MRNFLIVVLAATATAVATVATAGETPIGAGCSITATAPSTGSSASDSDCVWRGGVELALQCDVAVYYTKTGSAPTAASPKVAVGDPYPLGPALGDSDGQPVRILPVSGAATCYVYKVTK